MSVIGVASCVFSCKMLLIKVTPKTCQRSSLFLSQLFHEMFQRIPKADWTEGVDSLSITAICSFGATIAGLH